MRYTVTCEDLAWLEQEGYWVDPDLSCYLAEGSQVDGVLCSEEQVVRHLKARPLHEDSRD